jgi:hypothetical protein
LVWWGKARVSGKGGDGMEGTRRRSRAARWWSSNK